MPAAGHPRPRVASRPSRRTSEYGVRTSRCRTGSPPPPAAAAIALAVAPLPPDAAPSAARFLVELRHHVLDVGVVLERVRAQVLAVAGLLVAAVRHLRD